MNGAVPLTWAERSVWMASMLSANPLSYNAACILAINGALSTRRLIDALGRALASDCVLSLRVIADKGDLTWRSDGPAAPSIDVREDLQSDPLAELTQLWRAAPIKADSAPLAAVHVFKHRPNQHFVMLRHHHVLLDFQGAAMLLNRVAAIYNGDGQPGPENRRAEIAAAEAAYFSSALYHEDERYWRARMSGLAPGALSDPALAPSTAGRIDIAISSRAFAAFASTARSHGSTPFQSLLLNVYGHLEREQQGDVVFGIPLASRAGVLNSQSRMLPFRVGLSPALRRCDAVAAIRVALKTDIARAHFPIWESTAAIFPGARRGALPKIAINFMRARSFRFGAAAGVIARMLYGERNAETYIRFVEDADGQLSVSLDSARDRDWVEGLGKTIKSLASRAFPG